MFIGEALLHLQSPSNLKKEERVCSMIADNVVWKARRQWAENGLGTTDLTICWKVEFGLLSQKWLGWGGGEMVYELKRKRRQQINKSLMTAINQYHHVFSSLEKTGLFFCRVSIMSLLSVFFGYCKLWRWSGGQIKCPGLWGGAGGDDISWWLEWQSGKTGIDFPAISFSFFFSSSSFIPYSPQCLEIW